MLRLQQLSPLALVLLGIMCAECLAARTAPQRRARRAPMAALGPVPEGHFRCGGGIYKHKGEGFEQGQQSVVARVSNQEGRSFIMKRPRYHDTLWDDNLRKECQLPDGAWRAGHSELRCRM